MKEENDKINFKENKDGNVVVTIKEIDGTEHNCNLFYNKEKDFQQQFKIFKNRKKCSTVISALLIAITLACVNGINNYKKEVDAKKIEDEQRKNSFEFNIENTNLTIVSAFFKEALEDLEAIKDNNLAVENIYKSMYNELVLAEKENYAEHIKEGAKLASNAGIYFGVGKYEKYLNAKNIAGEIYFPLSSAIPAYSEEELVGNIVIIYLPNDTTPYVSESELEEFRNVQEIDSYIHTL